MQYRILSYLSIEYYWFPLEGNNKIKNSSSNSSNNSNNKLRLISHQFTNIISSPQICIERRKIIKHRHNDDNEILIFTGGQINKLCRQQKNPNNNNSNNNNNNRFRTNLIPNTKMFAYIPSLKKWFSHSLCSPIKSKTSSATTTTTSSSSTTYFKKEIHDCKYLYLPHPYYTLLCIGGYCFENGKPSNKVYGFNYLKMKWDFDDEWPNLPQPIIGNDDSVVFYMKNVDSIILIKIEDEGCCNYNNNYEKKRRQSRKVYTMKLNTNKYNNLRAESERKEGKEKTREQKYKPKWIMSNANFNGYCTDMDNVTIWNDRYIIFLKGVVILHDHQTLNNEDGKNVKGIDDNDDDDDKEEEQREKQYHYYNQYQTGGIVYDSKYDEFITLYYDTTTNKNNSKKNTNNTISNYNEQEGDYISSFTPQQQQKLYQVQHHSICATTKALSSSSSLATTTTITPSNSTIIAYKNHILVMGGYMSHDISKELQRGGYALDYEDHVDNCIIYQVYVHNDDDDINDTDETKDTNDKCRKTQKERFIIVRKIINANKDNGTVTTTRTVETTILNKLLSSTSKFPKTIPDSLRGASILIYRNKLTLFGGLTTFSRTFHSDRRKKIWQYHNNHIVSLNGEGDDGKWVELDTATERGYSKTTTTTAAITTTIINDDEIDSNDEFMGGWFTEKEVNVEKIRLPVPSLLYGYAFSLKL